MDKYVVEVDHLKKSYGNKLVIDDLSFKVKESEVFGLLGQNGAGKSTTIEIILGLKQQDEGKALIFGKEAKLNRSTIFEDIGVQLQSSNYQDGINVEELLQQYSAFYQKTGDYHELVEKFELEPLLKQKVNTLSMGQKQKLSVALALINNPKIVFLDELTTGLDVVARKEVWHILKDLKQKGLSIFLTTHYMEEAQALCDHIMIIKKGKCVIEGSVDKVIAKCNAANLEEAYLKCME